MLDELIIAFLFLCVCIPSTLQQPPGVPPHRQQPPQQQVYPDGHQPPAGHHQGAPPAGHHPGGHQGGGNFGVNPHDADHVKEHLKDMVDKPKDQMTEEELEFHYFKLHDYDNNNKLDGVEIVKAITHFHADEHDDSKPKPARKIFTDREISSIIDMVLQEDDHDGDGYITYAEFAAAQRKSRADIDSHNKEGEEGVREGETDEDLNHKPHDIKVYPDQDIANIVDNTLDQHDANDDGYIEYAEFVRAQRKARGKTDY